MACQLNKLLIQNQSPILILGPCSVENRQQMTEIFDFMKRKNIDYIRGGTYKPRTSPRDFQGLGRKGLELLHEGKKLYNFKIVSEIMDPRDIELGDEYLDIIQIGSRNMQNFSLLKEAGKANKPILLKRGLSATIKEFICAAEYISTGGNNNIILCERGIRTFEEYTRNTLDISCVPIIKKETGYPVIVDVSHSTGIKDIMIPCMKAALAVGADGIMAEVHPNPKKALSDKKQQLNISEAEKLIDEFNKFSKLLKDNYMT
ncbi:3-deoxy-7-phosphoheptulonate synthase, partial [Staphylococcus pseudintermedius]|nr:3-deoxy-7-phosphoheptulonate synthase [Staphylococcus pseudintermedius]